MEDMIRQGISLGLSEMCFTEHNDFDYSVSEDVPQGMFELNPDSYLYELIKYKEKYADQITIRFGLELGLQKHLSRRNAAFAKAHEYDFIIASSHICGGRDPYYPSFFEGRTKEEAYREYFESILENLKVFSNFDVYGHLDYVVRYGPAAEEGYSYEMYQEILEKILQKILDMGKGIELNTSAFAKGLKEPNPCTDILKRYRSLGGELITVGSDAHSPAQIACAFDRAADILKDCGFTHYATFENRSPVFHKL
jgi:histidinol-phosphatase (PHP family)